MNKAIAVPGWVCELLLLCVGPHAAAQDSHAYMGLAVGQTHSEFEAQTLLQQQLPLGSTLGPLGHDRSSSALKLFGGYWRSLSKDDHSFVAPALVLAGATVVLPEYSLCPAVSIEQIALQMTQALAWVYRHASDWGGDPKRIVVAGHSAGGHLAAMLLCCRWRDLGSDLPPQLVHGGLSISGFVDLEPRHTPFLKDDLRLTPASVKRLSPAFFPRPKRPLMAVVGAQECDGNPPDRPKAPEVEFSTKEFLREEVKIYRQPDHGCAQTG